jgi:hypothetical protein
MGETSDSDKGKERHLRIEEHRTKLGAAWRPFDHRRYKPTAVVQKSRW